MSQEHLQGDLNVAAFLVTRGYKLLGLVSNDSSGRYSFRFQDNDDEVARAAMEYFEGAVVAAKAFAAAQRDLKSLLYGRRRDENGRYTR